MIIQRETLYTAIFDAVTPLLAPGATVGGPIPGQAPGTPTAQRPFNVVSRETVEVQRVSPGLQPALFMDEAVEDFVERGAGLVLHKVTIYFHVGVTSTPGTPASTILNPILDLLEDTLNAAGANRFGLGDLIDRCQFGGLGVKNLGNNGTDPTARQAVAYLPFEITFP